MSGRDTTFRSMGGGGAWLRGVAAALTVGGAGLIAAGAFQGSAADQLRTALGEGELVQFTAPYPKGAWRLSRHELPNVSLTVSHIVVLHRDSDGTAANFRAPEWEPSGLPGRTRREAETIAAQLARSLRERPELFEEYARKYSDDVVTRERGGSLGTWSAALIPPTLLDALATLRPGEVSRAVESPFGFHVLKLRETAPDERVAARRIVVSYRGVAPNLKRLGRSVTCTRDQALARANDLARQARRDAASFASLVARHSDHSDALRGGDFGVWSTRRSAFRNVEVEAISQLAVGGVSEPVDGYEGFSVFIRDPVTERPMLAWEQIVPALMRTPTRGAEHDAAQVEQRATSIAQALAREPARFDELRKSYCCETIEQAASGQGVPAIEVAVAQLAVGEVLPRAIEVLPGDLRIVRRAAPRPSSPEPPVRTVLPAPREPDLGYLLEHAPNGAALAEYVAVLHTRALRAPGPELPGGVTSRLEESAAALTRQLRVATPEQRLGAVERSLHDVRETLGAAVAERYRARVLRELANDLMQQP